MQEKKVLNEETIGLNVKNTEYAIRGLIVQRADELNAALKKGEKLPFKKLLYCNIGNPLSLGQPTFTFDREVLSCALNPELLKSPSISEDAKARAKKFIDGVEYPHALGAYTSSSGLAVARESVKKYIEERDGFPANINNIFLTNGASDGVTTIFNILFNGPKDAVNLNLKID
jgi:alanine transaminase